MAILGDVLAKAKSDRNKNLPAKKILEKIYLGYMEEDKEKQKVSFSPSGLLYGAGQCGRRWVISFNSGMFHTKAGPIQRANMQNGVLAHQRIQSAMLASGLVTEDQIEVEAKYVWPPIRGFADFKAEIDGIMYLGEIKTTKHSNFEYRKATNIVADYHLGQMLIYMHILELMHGVIVYESKDTNELHGIVIEMTPERKEWVEYLLDWCRNVWALYETNQVPQMSFRKGSKVCQACPVESRCYNESTGEIKVERLKLPE